MDPELIAARDQALAYWTDPQRWPTDTDIEFNRIIERNFVNGQDLRAINS